MGEPVWISLICRNAQARFGDIFLADHLRGKFTMWPTRENFRIQASNFDLTNGSNILRIICGLFFFPHVLGKFAAGTVSAATVGFFAKAGFHPPELWVWVAAISETAVGVALVLGICTRFAALGACALLAIAVYSLQMVKGFGWTWNTGGYEYPVFWAIVSLAVAIEAWKRHARQVPAQVSPSLATVTQLAGRASGAARR